MRTDILGVGVDSVTIDEAVAQALKLMACGRGAYVCTPNPEIVWRARKQPELRSAINGADLVLPDGIGVVWASGMLGQPLPERVAGYDFFITLLDKMDGTVFLLGGKPGVAEEAARRIERDFSCVRVVGCCSGYFESDEEIIKAISAAKPDLLVVCLGSPNQELWMARQGGKLPVGLMAGLGGCLDVLSGRSLRAPEPWIRRNLEWLYRLVKEPSRIKRQICLPRFVLAVMAQRIKR